MKRILRAVALTCLLAATACTDERGPNISGLPDYAIVSVRVTPPVDTIFVPDTIRATDRAVFFASATGKDNIPLPNLRYAWRSSDPTIATVDSAGVVTPVRTGTVTIRASAGKVGHATLVILPATEAVRIVPVTDTIFVDEPVATASDSLRIRALAVDVFGQDLEQVAFEWHSTSPAVATVDATGLVRAVSLGVTTVTATAQGRSGQGLVHVVPVVAAVEVTSPATQVLALDTLQLSAVARAYDGTPISRAFGWTSSNPSVATVDASGRVVFLAAGQVTFTARSAFRVGSTTITALERRLVFIDAGEDFTCGVAPLGRGYCWGVTDDGRTAAEADSSCFDGLAEQHGCILPPKRMNRPDLRFATLSAGGESACGITIDQQLYCWGSDTFGQIGNGGAGGGSTPALATVKQERFTVLSVGHQHACALNLTGTAYCWGNDAFGQLGDDRRGHSTTPIPVADTTLQFAVISAGGRHTCALTISGAAYCWGDGAQGQLGNGGTLGSEVPTPVAGGLSFVAISAGGSHTCAIDTVGAVHCWGDNSRGQLGVGVSGGTRLTPTPIPGASGYSQISAAVRHTCGITSGVAVCWGGSDFGEAGDGNVIPHDVVVPTAVSGAFQASAIVAGYNHTCAISSVSQLTWCWGSNRFGTLGNEYQAAARATPQLVSRPR